MSRANLDKIDTSADQFWALDAMDGGSGSGGGWVRCTGQIFWQHVGESSVNDGPALYTRSSAPRRPWSRAAHSLTSC